MITMIASVDMAEGYPAVPSQKRRGTLWRH
jgi:hypothetical protein